MSKIKRFLLMLLVMSTATIYFQACSSASAISDSNESDVVCDESGNLYVSNVGRNAYLLPEKTVKKIKAEGFDRIEAKQYRLVKQNRAVRKKGKLKGKLKGWYKGKNLCYLKQDGYLVKINKRAKSFEDAVIFLNRSPFKGEKDFKSGKIEDAVAGLTNNTIRLNKWVVKSVYTNDKSLASQEYDYKGVKFSIDIPFNADYVYQYSRNNNNSPIKHKIINNFIILNYYSGEYLVLFDKSGRPVPLSNSKGEFTLIGVEIVDNYADNGPQKIIRILPERKKLKKINQNNIKNLFSSSRKKIRKRARSAYDYGWYWVQPELIKKSNLKFYQRLVDQNDIEDESQLYVKIARKQLKKYDKNTFEKYKNKKRYLRKEDAKPVSIYPDR